jgi:hypothetical protein
MWCLADVYRWKHDTEVIISLNYLVLLQEVTEESQNFHLNDKMIFSVDNNELDNLKSSSFSL